MALSAVDRFEGIEFAQSDHSRTLRDDVLAGLRMLPQATLPAKLLYDDRGCSLFDRICELPEYYPTRTERRLLEEVAPDIARRSDACELVELGSGLARKTHVLLDALSARQGRVRYVPFDVSEGVIRTSAERLLRRYPQLHVRGVVGDFTCHLRAIPSGRRRLVAFLGGTIGNFDESESTEFLEGIAGLLDPDDHFLLAADLVKPRELLHAAYNDSAGVTAAFNLNALRRMRKELGLRLNELHFRHDAFFDEATSRIEIHARACTATRVEAPSDDLDRSFEEGESIRTEISRKFTPAAIETMLGRAGLEIVSVYDAVPAYALTLARLAR